MIDGEVTKGNSTSNFLSENDSSPNESPSNIVSIERGEKIGSGGFSNVYKVYVHSLDEKNQKLKSKIGAMKFITCSQNSGLESLMEAHIMRYISHPNINHAWGVQSDKLGNVTIIQPLALGDVSSLIRKKFNKLSPTTLKKWLWQIVTAIAKLHSKGILHGDIKAGNILIFSNNPNSLEIPPININGRSEPCLLFDNMYIKLNDFSLSRLISNPEEGTLDTPRHISYTSTHRALEVWKGINYSFPADIWALGCTIYEISYGCLLFQDQSTNTAMSELDANIQAFEDWASRNITPTSMGKDTSLKKYTSFIGSPRQEIFPDNKLISLPLPERPFVNNIHLATLPIPIPQNKNHAPTLSHSAPLISSLPLFSNYKKCKISPEWENVENEVLNDLILSMLNINAKERLTIWEIIDHEYFNDMRSLESCQNNENLSTYKHLLSSPDKYMNTVMYHAIEDTSFEPEKDSLPFPDERYYPTVIYTFDGVSQSVIDEAKSMTTNLIVMQLAVSLYQRARESTIALHIPRPSLKGCVIVAHKLLYLGPPVNFGLIGIKYLQDEINLCLCLNYKMLPHSSDRKTPKT